MCDKKLLTDDLEIYIPPDKVDLSCPAHSNRPIKETGYMRKNKYVHENGECCDICRRKINLKDKNQYEILTKEDDEGVTITLRCRICKEKGRL